MDKQQAQRIVQETLGAPFDKAAFIKLVKELFNEIDESKAFHVRGYVPEAYKKYVKTYERVATYTDPDNLKIDILIVYLQSETTLERARTSQRNFIAHYLKERGQKDAGLVAFVSPDPADWRFSLVKIDYKIDEKGKVKDDFTPARRWSFLVGANENSHTARSRLSPLILDDAHNPTLAELEEAFNIEIVTKEFFTEYRDLFIRIKEALDHLVDADVKIKNNFAQCGVNTVDFAKKLLGQIIFLYFLQKKGWFGVGRDAGWGTGSKQFLRELFEEKHGNYKNFFNNILEPLFYDALRIDRSHDDHYYSRFNCKIPFLNGGLFDPLNNYDWVHTDILIPNELFSNKYKTAKGDTGSGILDIFDRYNFTVKEDEPLEKEVAIDPELLGKAYEKFNAIRPDNFAEYQKALKSGRKGEESKFNKQFGVYYTPREIVHYMCQQSLINYLCAEFNGGMTTYEKPGIKQTNMLGNMGKSGQLDLTIEHKERPAMPKEDIEKLIHYGERITETEAMAVAKEENISAGKQKTTKIKSFLSESIRSNAQKIDEKLSSIKVCDPAIGSGAFPVGMMNEIVRTRNVLSNFIKDNDRSPYRFKRECIENSLYGVDIDSGAVEIAKLRLWLSLVVDEDDIKQIKPLPNLDYKIVCGNSLLGLPFDILPDDEISKELEEKKKQYLSTTNPTEKNKINTTISDLFSQLMENIKKYDPSVADINFDFHTHFSEVFHEMSGFDVVIGNPPYGAALSINDVFYFKKYYVLKTSETAILFIEKGANLLSKRGSLCYIIPKAFTFASNYKETRRYVEKDLTAIVDCGKAFEQVRLEACIIQLVNDSNLKTYTSLRFSEDLEFCKLSTIDKKLKTMFGFYPNGLTEAEIEIGKQIFTVGQYLKDVANNSRGELLQEYIKENGNYEVIGGKEIDRYGIRGIKGLIDKEHLSEKSKINDNSILVQNIVAHITNPYDQIKIIACIPDKSNCEITDTINQLTLVDKAYSRQFLWSILNSKLINWYVYLFIFGKAIRTMHFDNTVTDRIPIPIVNSSNQISFKIIVDYIIFLKQRNKDISYFETILDAMVYELYLFKEISRSGCAILEHLKHLTECNEAWDDHKKLYTIEKVYKTFIDKAHPVNIAIKKMKCLPEIGIIERLDNNKKSRHHSGD